MDNHCCLEWIVCFVDIGEIVDHLCLNFFFIIYTTTYKVGGIFLKITFLLQLNALHFFMMNYLMCCLAMLQNIENKS